MIKNFYYQIDEKLCMPMESVHFPTNENIAGYSKIINDITEGGADIASTSPVCALMALSRPTCPPPCYRLRRLRATSPKNWQLPSGTGRRLVNIIQFVLQGWAFA